MADVVDSDELLRRMHRARACALEEERAWQSRSEALRSSDPAGSRDAAVRTLAYEAVLRVLDEILTPGRQPEGAERSNGQPGYGEPGAP
ncbi:MULTISPECIES: hypothetical protein [unclassified Streptomyces]|uniref:hypothetical protein n=1 Tax=unclassified Streptomyces TaxID=2593676 RepID=UPI0036ED51DD